MPSKGLPKNERLSASEVKSVFEKGKRVRGRFLTVIYAAQPESVNKIAAVIPKKHYKKAADRNRVKRLIREAYRNNKSIFPASRQLVFYLHSIPAELSQQVVIDEIMTLAGKIK